jgi:two-component system response regulator VicR
MKKRILYVEDDDDTRDFVRKLLEKEGYIVDVASNGCDGLAKIAEVIPDLVILDMMLPDMSGWDVFNKMLTFEKNYCVEHKRNKSSPLMQVMFLSIIPISEARMEFLRAYGVSDYVMKPFDNAELLRRIKAVI